MDRKRFSRLLYLLVCMLVPALPVLAQPDLRKGRSAGGLTVYPDDAKAGLFYYAPGDISLAIGTDGRPDLSFLQMRYTGSVVSADQGTSMHRSILTFQVRMSRPSAEQLRGARDLLREGAKRTPDLRPLPIRRLEAALVYTGVNSSEGENPEKPLNGGHFEADGTGSSNAYWQERTYTLGLENATSQLFWDALKKGQMVISVGYAFYADGIAGDRDLAELSGSATLVQALRTQIESRRATTAGSPTLVKAGATAIQVDAKRWPELFQQVDINESVPPGYPALDIYCYDFNDKLRPDLAEKLVEIEAEGVTGRRVKLGALFRQDQPDLYVRGVRFPLAARLDRPFRYRITEVGLDGASTESAWRERSSWTELLDVTSNRPRVATQPSMEEEP